VPVDEFIAAERERILNRELVPAVIEMHRSFQSLSSQWREKFYAFWNLPDDFEL
jgi:hypothetical protein